jgi:Chaperone of endosialidase
MKYIKLYFLIIGLIFLVSRISRAQDTTLSVTSDGNIGIGTSDPQQKLHVAGGYILVDGIGSEKIYIGGDGAGNDAQVGSFNSAITNFAVWNEGSKTRMNFYANDIFAFGNLGIGTTQPTSPLTVNGIVESKVGGFMFPDGTSQLTAATGGQIGWNLLGNAGTDSSAFIGTIDANPLQFRINNRRVLRIEPTHESEGPNVITGSYVNSVAPGVVGATISGGGDPSDAAGVNPNRVTARFGTVGGGAANTAGHDAVVAGGYRNSATGTQSAVLGGFQNNATGFASTIPGGANNEATGQHSFAVGQRAKALHNGSFVFSDTQNTDFESTDQNQFLIRANGGVGIGTSEPQQPLHVAGGYILTDGLNEEQVYIGGDGSGNDAQIGSFNSSVTNLAIWNEGSKTRMNFFAKDIFAFGNVGIGTTSVSNPLQLSSGAHVTAGGVWTDASSREYKENISNLTIEEAISALVGLNPVKYNYKVQKNENYVGFIAEDVPDLVATNNRQSLSPMDIVAVLTKIVQQQNKKITELEARLDAGQL